jgi:demethylmenaquinone methyltransferase/2-methoxy-6-polyprenyl-1,4-benzoquinol methylase
MCPRYDAEWIADLLDVRGRLGEATPDAFLFQHGLHRGHAVVDVGCGPGLFTLAAAGMVGRSGWVHAVDVSQEMLDLVDREAESRRLDNVFTVQSAGGAVPLPDQAGDFVMCMQALHYREDVESQTDMVRDLARLVRPPGSLVIVNWKPEMRVGPLLQPDVIVEILRERGLECEGPSSLGERHDVVVARRVEGERMTVRRPAHRAADGG